ncbi:MAG TPA: DMT family transporter, partial [Gammaproteobacteria bacterium]|nr:DMT family transporter [Gammaproteobacteria bacterium]
MATPPPMPVLWKRGVELKRKQLHQVTYKGRRFPKSAAFLFLYKEKKMSVPAAYMGVIILWATTPLAVKWSVDGSSFLFGVTSRMTLGVLLCLLLVWLIRIEFPWHKAAQRIYLVAGLGIYGAMLSVYWGAQYIPSGLIAVIFGLTPLATGVMAALWLGEQALSPARVAGMVLGIAGLAVIFDAGKQWESSSWMGISAMLVSVLVHSASGVWVKRLGSSTRLHPIAVNTGALSFAVPLFLLTWVITDRTIPETVTFQAAASIAYLG